MVPFDKIWTPYIGITNAIENPFEHTQSPDFRITLHKDGHCLFSPDGTFIFRCGLNLWNFPFDSQRCFISIEKYRYFDSELNLIPGDFRLENFNENDQWIVELDGSEWQEMFYRNVSDYAINFNFIFKRKSLYYTWSIILPCLCVAIVELATFAVPFESFVRLQLSFMSLLSFSVFQGLFLSRLPTSSDHPPLLFIYIGIMTAAIAILIVLQAMAIYFFDVSRHSKRLPGYLCMIDQRSNKNHKEIALKMAKICNNIGFYLFSIFIFLLSPIFLASILPFLEI